MNHCQNHFSCFSCCGLFNFKVSYHHQILILKERTKEFRNLGSINRESLLRYRSYRENIEEHIPRYDKQVYICPFLGYLENTKIGCMIHPSLWKEKDLQDVSFYKSTICQTYDCKVKQQDQNYFYFAFVTKVVNTNFSQRNIKKFINADQDLISQEHKTFLYSRLMADVVLYIFILYYFELQQVIYDQSLYRILFYLACARLKSHPNVTSFEINYLNFSLQNFEENLGRLLPELKNKKKFINKAKMFIQLC